MKDLYSILGVERTAFPEEIKKAYRRRSIETHPDKGGDGEEFREVQTAYDILGDPQKRRVYDEGGDVASAEQGMNRLEVMLRAGVNKFINAAKNGARVNLLAEVKKDVANAIRTKRDELEDARESLERLLPLRGSVKRKDEERLNIFESAIEQQIHGTRITIAACEGDLRDGAEMLRLLDEYESAEKPSLADLGRESAVERWAKQRPGRVFEKWGNGNGRATY